MGEACLRAPELLAASLSSQTYAQAGPRGVERKAPEVFLPGKAVLKGSEGKWKGSRQESRKPSPSASLLGTGTLSSLAQTVLLVAASTTLA